MPWWLKKNPGSPTIYTFDLNRKFKLVLKENTIWWKNIVDSGYGKTGLEQVIGPSNKLYLTSSIPLTKLPCRKIYRVSLAKSNQGFVGGKITRVQSLCHYWWQIFIPYVRTFIKYISMLMMLKKEEPWKHPWVPPGCSLENLNTVRAPL